MVRSDALIRKQTGRSASWAAAFRAPVPSHLIGPSGQLKSACAPFTNDRGSQPLCPAARWPASNPTEQPAALLQPPVGAALSSNMQQLGSVPGGAAPDACGRRRRQAGAAAAPAAATQPLLQHQQVDERCCCAAQAGCCWQRWQAAARTGAPSSTRCSVSAWEWEGVGPLLPMQPVDGARPDMLLACPPV